MVYLKNKGASNTLPAADMQTFKASAPYQQQLQPLVGRIDLQCKVLHSYYVWYKHDNGIS